MVRPTWTQRSRALDSSAMDMVAPFCGLINRVVAGTKRRSVRPLRLSIVSRSRKLRQICRVVGAGKNPASRNSVDFPAGMMDSRNSGQKEMEPIGLELQVAHAHHVTHLERNPAGRSRARPRNWRGSRLDLRHR